MDKKLAVAAIIVIIIIIGGAIAWWYLTKPPAVQPIKIGFHAPLTGFAAADGLSALHGAQLAVQHINAKGGVLGRPLKLIYYDDACDPDEAIAIAHKLIEEDRVVAAISGSYSHPTLAASAIFNESGIPYISAYAVHPEITRDKPYVFRVGLTGVPEGKAMGYVAGLLNATRVAILYMDIPFGTTLAENAKAYIEDVLGGEVIYYEKYELGETDFSTWLTEIKALNPDAILAPAYYSEAAHIVSQAKELGITAPIIGCEGYDSPKFLELAGDAAEGTIIVTDLDRDSPRELVQTFLSDYKNMTGIEADMVGASAYDAVLVLAKAIEAAGSLDPDDIVNALKNLENVEMVTGTLYYFTEQGNACKPMVAQIVREGEFHHYADITDPDIITPPE